MPTNGGTNQVAPIQATAQGAGFQVQTGLAGQAGYPAAGPIKGAVLPYWSYGAGAPASTFNPPYGSLYTNTTAIAGASILYCFKPNATGPGSWHVII